MERPITIDSPQGRYSRLYIAGVWIGLGTREECEALAQELREKPALANELYLEFEWWVEGPRP